MNLSGSADDLVLPTDAASAASKGAVEAMTRVLAPELRGRGQVIQVDGKTD